MGAWDILVIAFGVMVFFVGLTYAELTSAMPQCGGEHVFSYRAMGTTGSFGCDCQNGCRLLYITGKKCGDRHTRDILLNSSLLGWDATAQFIEELVERRFGLTEEKLEKGA